MLTLVGPYRFLGDGPTIDNINLGVLGVYVWCVKTDDLYRVHYVGEALDVKGRQRFHKRKQLAGEYDAFCPEALGRNVKILMHRANEGMIPRFAQISAEDLNCRYLAAMSVFYGDLGQSNKNVRCAYESALVRAIQDFGQNVLHVGRVRLLPVPAMHEVMVVTPGVQIEALSNAVVKI